MFHGSGKAVKCGSGESYISFHLSSLLSKSARRPFNIKIACYNVKTYKHILSQIQIYRLKCSLSNNTKIYNASHNNIVGNYKHNTTMYLPNI